VRGDSAAEWGATLGLLGAVVAAFALVARWALRGWRWGPGLPSFTPPPEEAATSDGDGPPRPAGRVGAAIDRVIGVLAVGAVGALALVVAVLAVGVPLLAITAMVVHQLWPGAPYALWALALTGGVLGLLGLGAVIAFSRGLRS
jgi:hypothetical protein